VGVGKTTLVEEMSGLLRQAEIAHAAVDFDQLTASYPRSPDDDAWGTELGLANLAALWRNFSELGADRLLIARVIEHRRELDGFQRAVPGAEIVVVRLRASLETMRARVRRRGTGLSMEWHLNRAGELAASMDAAPFEDLLVETEGRHQTDLARDVLDRLGWLDATSGRRR
jgi:adenylylsulfate kinase